MKKNIFLVPLFLTLNLLADSLAKDGVEITVTNSSGKKESIEIYRDLPDDCTLDVKFNPKTLWSEAYASSKIPKECKVTIVSAVGKVSPMKIAEGIETYGELEVLQFLKQMQSSKNMLFIDSRTSNWYKYQTIPGAINIPYTYFTKPDKFSSQFSNSLKLMGITKQKNDYNFKDAKTILLFCNGPWYGQSPVMIKKLLKLGYPTSKIKWYRGGMHSWLSLNFISTKDKE